MTEEDLREDVKDREVAIWIVIWLALFVPSTIWRGYVLTLLWAWFVVPFGIFQIEIAHAIGLSATVAVFAHVKLSSDFEDVTVKEIRKTVTYMLAAPAGILGAAAIIHAFM